MANERIDKVISNMGYASRREVAIAAKQGRLSINGVLCKKSDTKVDPLSDKIIFEGQEIEYQKFVYIMLNKKAGYITATEDKKQETVLELLDERYKKMGLFPAGRLDKDTEGLLILTNDGDFSHFIMSPKNHVPKVYYAEITGKTLGEEDVKAFYDGIELYDGTICKSAVLEILNQNDPQEVKITISEGKFHQIKRMVHEVSAEVVYLKRLKIGELELDKNLEIGEYRQLTQSEIDKFYGA